MSLAGFIEEPERKYCFECATEEQCQEWVEALKRARWAEPWEPGHCWGLWAVLWDQEQKDSASLLPDKLPSSSE